MKRVLILLGKNFLVRYTASHMKQVVRLWGKERDVMSITQQAT